MNRLKPDGLIVDPEFRRLEQGLSEARCQEMEARLLADGCRMPVQLWKNLIVAGFCRYDFCLRNGLPISTRQIPAQTRREALSWSCAAQLRREDLTQEMRVYLIGKRYTVEKGLFGHGRRTPGGLHTAARLGLEYGVNYHTVTSYGSYAEAVDRLAGTAPQFTILTLTGSLALTRADLLRISRLPEDELRLAEADPEAFVCRHHLLRKRPKRLAPPKADSPIPMLVKQMPDYDPDGEISGLTLTIPSWIGSIRRAQSNADVSAISSQALERLAEQLICLAESVEALFSAIKEGL